MKGCIPIVFSNSVPSFEVTVPSFEVPFGVPGDKIWDQNFKFRWFLGPSDQNPKSAIHTPLLSKILDFSDRKNLWYPFKCNMLFFRNSLWTWGRCHAKCWICGYVGMVMWISVNGNVPDLDHLISTVMDRDLIKTMKRIFGLVLKLVTVLMLTQLTMQNQIGRRLNPQPMQAGQQDLGP